MISSLSVEIWQIPQFWRAKQTNFYWKWRSCLQATLTLFAVVSIPYLHILWGFRKHHFVTTFGRCRVCLASWPIRGQERVTWPDPALWLVADPWILNRGAPSVWCGGRATINRQSCTITEKDPTRTFSWLKAASMLTISQYHIYSLCSGHRLSGAQ